MTYLVTELYCCKMGPDRQAWSTYFGLNHVNMSDIYTSNSICLELTRTAVALHPKYFPENPYTGKAAMCYDECIIKVH